MSELTDAIDAFLAKYPDDLPLEWRDKPSKVVRPTLRSEFGDLAIVAERWNALELPPAKPWKPSPEEVAEFRARLMKRWEAIHG